MYKFSQHCMYKTISDQYLYFCAKENAEILQIIILCVFKMCYFIMVPTILMLHFAV